MQTRDGRLLPFPGALADGARACIIGAGISGLTAAKALKDRGLPFDLFEREEGIGGLWRIDSERSPAYHSLHINSSRDNMELADFPLPEDFPVFAHHTEVLRYFERYAGHFGLYECISFRTHVTRVAPVPGEPGQWEVTIEGAGGESADGEPETRRYGGVLVCNGHHWKPRRPAFPGTFAGTEMHAFDYRTPAAMTGENVLVVGLGNSACDIAVDLTRSARRVALSSRSGAHVLPKYLLGLPLDQWTTRFFEKWVPLGVRRALLRLLVFLTVGNQEWYGLPRPAHRLFEGHPTISQELLSFLGRGRVRVRPDVERLDGDIVWFAGGTHAHFDRIIYATGYDIEFPFLPDEVLAVTNNEVALYRHVVAPGHPGLYFIGLVQALGALMPIAELQSRWVAGLLAGALALPNDAYMQKEIRRTEARMQERYYRAARHTIQVDFHDYQMTLEKEIARGRKRMRQLRRTRATAL